MPEFDLIIDTSIFGAAVGLGTGDDSSRKLIFSDVTHEIQDSARRLPLIVEQAMNQAGIKAEDIGRMVISQGPGSFTGIRVGLAYAYGFFKGLISKANPQAKIAGVSSLQVLATHFGGNLGQDVAVFLPSTKTTGYAATFSNGNSSLLPLDLAKGVDAVLLDKVWLVLGAWNGLSEAAQSAGIQTFQNMDPRENARLALGVINDRLSADSGLAWSEVMPGAIYLRKSTVEEKAEAGK
jgi:tRNA threonylcarbamoyl adenosine modification protein YeaZ